LANPIELGLSAAFGTAGRTRTDDLLIVYWVLGGIVLAGNLLDENRHHLYAQGAASGGRRYRYHMSRDLVGGWAEQLARRWRVSDREVESSRQGGCSIRHVFRMFGESEI